METGVAAVLMQHRDARKVRFRGASQLVVGSRWIVKSKVPSLAAKRFPVRNQSGREA